MADLRRLDAEDFCYVTTIGRKTGLERTIEIWFAIGNETLYMLSGGRDRADWVRNIRHDSRVIVRIGRTRLDGRGRLIEPGTEEDAYARRLLASKYQAWREGQRLSGWARTALPVAVDFVGLGSKTA